MNNQQHGARSGSYSVPTLFAFCDAIFSENCKEIVKNKRSRLKRQAIVLGLVDPVLLIVPFQTASLYKMYKTVGGLIERRLKGVIFGNAVSGQHCQSGGRFTRSADDTSPNPVYVPGLPKSEGVHAGGDEISGGVRVCARCGRASGPD